MVERRNLRIVSLLLAMFLVISHFNFVGIVHCDEESLKNIFAALRASGFSEIAAAATVGCVYGESNGRPDTVEVRSDGGGKGIGIMQWSNEDRGYLADYCAKSEHSGHEKVTLKPAVGRSQGYTICNRIDCQLAFWMTEDLKPRLNGYHWSKNYNSQVQKLSILNSAAQAGRIPTTISCVWSYDGWMSNNDLASSVAQLCIDFYTPTASKCFWIKDNGTKLSSYSESSEIQTNFSKSQGTYDKRFTYAKHALEAFAGATYTPMPSSGVTQPGGGGVSSANDMATGLATQLYSAGYFSEAELASYCKLTETNLEEVLLAAADIENLRQLDLEGLSSWQRNHRMEMEEHGYIAVLRIVVVLVGILMTLWAIFVYLAFWFDHINSFVYLDALHIVTLGQLHICPPGDKPTFKLGKTVETRTVNHQQILGICGVALLFGTLLVSGVFYSIVMYFVNLVMGWVKS